VYRYPKNLFISLVESSTFINILFAQKYMEKATLCNTDAEVCEYRAAYLVNLSLNCLTIALNIIHIILMSKLANSKKTTYFWILINMSLTDIMVSAV